MTKRFFTAVMCFLAAHMIGNVQAGTEQPRRETLLDREWKFVRQDVTNAWDSQFADQEWRSVNLPHDWAIESPFNPQTPSGQSQGFFDAWGVGWYRKHFSVSASEQGRRLLVRFDGVFRNSQVWCNGQRVGGRPSGYVPQVFDLTPYINYQGDNVLAVRVEHSAPSDRWYSGAGIYRHVWLVSTATTSIEPFGIAVTSSHISSRRATVHVRTAITNSATQTCALRLVTEILDPSGIVCATNAQSIALASGGRNELNQKLTVAHPKRWSLEEPALYTIRSTVYSEGQLVDDVRTPFGIRDVQFLARKGFFLNGRNLKLKGVDLHHDLGCLGAASYTEAWERRLQVLREMGCNAIRASHNPPAPEFLDLCDRIGFLVIDEAFDKWKWQGGYYKDYFDEWWERDLAAMIERDRNHPSVILWSVGNEVENQGEPGMIEILERLATRARLLDPSRPVTCALEPHCNPRSLWEAPASEKVRRTLLMASKVDILGCNYHEQWYQDYHNADSRLLMIGTETYPFYRGRGNHFAAFEPVNPWFDVAQNDHVIGQFIWAGIDYLGEAQSWPSKGWASGLIDTCGIRKPQSWFFQSVWTDSPMVHLAVWDETKREPKQAPHWSWPPMSSHWTFPQRAGQMLRVAAFSNCETVELFLNGESLGRKPLSEFPSRIMEWHVPYREGTLKAIGYRSGKSVCQHELRTAGKACAMVIHPDRQKLSTQQHSLSHVEVQIVDKDGVLVPDAQQMVRFSIRGPGQLLGVDNGDLDSSEPFIATQRSAYLGRCMAIIRAEKAGTIELQASAPGLPTASARIHVEQEKE